MKKSLLVLTAALSFGFAAAQTDTAAPAPQVPTLTDVPAGHWAKDAIDKIVAKGIILGYPDGTYRGTQNLTRYEAAVIIARLLDQMGSGQVPASSLDADTMTSLQNAIQELAADLAALGVRVSDLEDNSVSKDDFARLEARVEELSSKSGDTSALDALTAQITDVTTRADELQSNYDSLRADVDDNASSIAALNDLTVLLNDDILGLQDRVSAVETAQADFVGRADFNALTGRVSTVETSVTSLDNRVAQLEKYAFSVKPSLTATYFVARATRNFDIDRLIAGTAFSSGNGGGSSTAVDYADFTGGLVPVVGGPDGLYGFAAGPGVVNVEGETNVGFSIAFSNSGSLGSGTSGQAGSLLTSAGGLNVNKLDVNFGVRAGLPTNGTVSAADAARYGDVVSNDGSGTVYRPLFFFFRNATASFTVGANPVIVELGRNQKFHFGDYVFDNDLVGRGDGFIVTVDGSNLPIFGAYKPIIKAVYGSRSVNLNDPLTNVPLGHTAGGTNAATGARTGGANGDNEYYRGIRAQITPFGTLTAGLNYAQEGADAFGGVGNASPSDVTVYGADLHGALYGFQIDSEFARSRILNRTTVVTDPVTAETTVAPSGLETATAFYARTSGGLGPVKIYDLNYRAVTANYDYVAGIMEATPGDTTHGSTAPFSPDQRGYGVKVGGALGPVALGAYYDRQTRYDTVTNPDSVIVDRGVAARVSLFSVVGLSGGYYEYLAEAGSLQNSVNASNTVTGNGVRYSVRAEVTPGLALSVAAYYRHVGDLTTGRGTAQSDGGLFANGKYNSYFPTGSSVFTNQTGCGDQHPGLATRDTDGVGGALSFSQRSFLDTTCYTEYGVEVAHDGKSDAAIVKNLNLRLGYANRYRDATASYSNSFLYGDAVYSAKLGIANVNLSAAFGQNRYSADELNGDFTDAAGAGLTPTPPANRTSAAVGLKVTTDTLPIIFKPSLEGQVGYYTSAYTYGTGVGAPENYTANGLKYVAGVKLNELLLPNTNLAVYYSGYRATNRQYTPVTADLATSAGFFSDTNNGAVTTLNGLYFEANYYDLNFAYGVYNLSQNVGGTETAAVNAAGEAVPARGQTFKIRYNVNF